MFKCINCGIEKPLTEFHKHIKRYDSKYHSCKPEKNGQVYGSGHLSICKSCRSTKRKEQYNPEIAKNDSLKSLYGITLEQYNSMLVRQNYCCFICGNHETSSTKGRLFVDHDHVTGKIRGLLCGKCNSLLGMAQDDPEILIKAIAYLREKE
jgi:hypothetical protein